jgi:hypothetical protein
MHDGFNCDNVHVELRNLAEDFGLVVSSILTPSLPFAMPNDLDEEIETTREVLKAQLMLKEKHGSFTIRCFYHNIFLW